MILSNYMKFRSEKYNMPLVRLWYASHMCLWAKPVNMEKGFHFLFERYSSH